MKTNSVRRIGAHLIGCCLSITVVLAVSAGGATAAAITFVSGISTPTGIAVHPSARKLYINSGASGRVWAVEIRSDGSSGGVSTLTEGFIPDLDIVFDAAGNLYGNEAGTYYLYRIGRDGQVSRTHASRTLSSGITIEHLGLPSSKLFINSDRPELYYFLPNEYESGGTTSPHRVGRTCANYRFMLYRQAVAGIAATFGGTVTNVNPTDGVCSPILSGLVQPNGLAEDTNGNLYVADTGSGRVIRIAPSGMSDVVATGLSSPTGLAFDPETRLLFVSEARGNRVSTISIGDLVGLCFESGAGAGYMKVCLSDDGTIEEFQAPLGFQQLAFNAPNQEGYALCSGIGGGIKTHGYDAGLDESGFGPATISQPGGPGTSPLSIVRKTTDGIFEVTQRFVHGAADKQFMILMTVKNLSTAPVSRVIVSRYFNGDIDGSAADDIYTRTRSSVLGTQGASRNGLGIFARSTGWDHNTRIEYMTDWDPLLGGSAQRCEVPGITPVGRDDYVGRLTYYLWTINPGASKTVSFLYRRH